MSDWLSVIAVVLASCYVCALVVTLSFIWTGYETRKQDENKARMQKRYALIKAERKDS